MATGISDELLTIKLKEVIMSRKRKRDIMEETGAVAEGHFVYKAGTHGPAYINKEAFPDGGAINLCNAIRQVVNTAVLDGMSLPAEEEIGLIGPAYGAIPFSLVAAEAMEKHFPDTKFFPARTELKEDESGKKNHYIPEKLLPKYRNKVFIVFEDIVNNGETIREIVSLFRRVANASVIVVLCFANRGGQTTKTLGVGQFFPLKDVTMTQHDANECSLCKAGIPINTVLGKGDRWVKLFGQPPYLEDFDFSAFFSE